MRKLSRIASVVGCTALLLGTTLAIGCGGKSDDSPAGLCKKIYKKRIDGPFKMFKEEGPKNKDAFDAYCAELPLEYLKCETKDLMKMGDKEMATCKDLMMTHQEGLNKVLETGKAK